MNVMSVMNYLRTGNNIPLQAMLMVFLDRIRRLGTVQFIATHFATILRLFRSIVMILFRGIGQGLLHGLQRVNQVLPISTLTPSSIPTSVPSSIPIPTFPLSSNATIPGMSSSSSSSIRTVLSAATTSIGKGSVGAAHGLRRGAGAAVLRNSSSKRGTILSVLVYLLLLWRSTSKEEARKLANLRRAQERRRRRLQLESGQGLSPSRGYQTGKGQLSLQHVGDDDGNEGEEEDLQRWPSMHGNDQYSRRGSRRRRRLDRSSQGKNIISSSRPAERGYEASSRSNRIEPRFVNRFQHQSRFQHIQSDPGAAITGRRLLSAPLHHGSSNNNHRNSSSSNTSNGSHNDDGNGNGNENENSNLVLNIIYPANDDVSNSRDKDKDKTHDGKESKSPNQSQDQQHGTKSRMKFNLRFWEWLRKSEAKPQAPSMRQQQQQQQQQRSSLSSENVAGTESEHTETVAPGNTEQSTSSPQLQTQVLSTTTINENTAQPDTLNDYNYNGDELVRMKDDRTHRDSGGVLGNEQGSGSEGEREEEEEEEEDDDGAYTDEHLNFDELALSYWNALKEGDMTLWEVLTSIHVTLGYYVSNKILVFLAYLGIALRYLSARAGIAPSFARDLLSRHSKTLQDDFQARLEMWLDSKMDDVADKVKEHIKDPDMPTPVSSFIDDAVSGLLPDAKRVLLTKTDELIKYRSPVNRYLVPVASERVLVKEKKDKVEKKAREQVDREARKAARREQKKQKKRELARAKKTREREFRRAKAEATNSNSRNIPVNSNRNTNSTPTSNTNNPQSTDIDEQVLEEIFADLSDFDSSDESSSCSSSSSSSSSVSSSSSSSSSATEVSETEESEEESDFDSNSEVELEFEANSSEASSQGSEEFFATSTSNNNNNNNSNHRSSNSSSSSSGSNLRNRDGNAHGDSTHLIDDVNEPRDADRKRKPHLRRSAARQGKSEAQSQRRIRRRVTEDDEAGNEGDVSLLSSYDSWASLSSELSAQDSSHAPGTLGDFDTRKSKSKSKSKSNGLQLQARHHKPSMARYRRKPSEREHLNEDDEAFERMEEAMSRNARNAALTVANRLATQPSPDQQSLNLEMENDVDHDVDTAEDDMDGKNGKNAIAAPSELSLEADVRPTAAEKHTGTPGPSKQYGWCSRKQWSRIKRSLNARRRRWNKSFRAIRSKVCCIRKAQRATPKSVHTHARGKRNRCTKMLFKSRRFGKLARRIRHAWYKMRALVRHPRKAGARIRAFLLYNMVPYDRSFWNCLKNPWWISLQILGVLPRGIGMTWWLAVFFMHDKRDEHQVCQFIVGFQTAKFFTQGCFSLVYGALLYYICASASSSMDCETMGPQVGEFWDGCFFMIQITLVWLAFFFLPSTSPCQVVHSKADAYLLDDAEKLAAVLGRREKGGRLAKLFWWDTFSVILVLLLALCAWGLAEQRGWQLRATLYWLRTIYGLLALPFVVFKVPVLDTILTPIKPTGYDHSGHVVLRVRTNHRLAQPPVLASSNPGSNLHSWSESHESTATTRG